MKENNAHTDILLKTRNVTIEDLLFWKSYHRLNSIETYPFALHLVIVMIFQSKY